MDLLQLAAFAFLAGLTACGVAASVCELLAKEQVRFAEPFVSGDHLRRSIFVAILAGPFMLINDALAAWRNGGVSLGTVAVCCGAAGFWLTAAGLIVMTLAAGLADLW